ncbi:unnamed protein product [Dovyalis caffra]|uniref:Uncharacterized protein n=1 Tax=Dovyalis caffra TaxID=77055 RepID=A0AAV1SMK8_9ROSI|nr:unnamed protein product [Dovyalis caffra]
MLKEEKNGETYGWIFIELSRGVTTSMDFLGDCLPTIERGGLGGKKKMKDVDKLSGGEAFD